MLTRLRREDGASAVEMGIVLPVLMALIAFTFPLIKGGLDYIVLSRAISHGVRYASRADENARVGPNGLTRRPTAGEVSTFISSAADPVDVTSVSVVPDPSLALPGEPILVSATFNLSYGVLADIANAVKAVFFGGGASLPDSGVVTVSGRGREE